MIASPTKLLFLPGASGNTQFWHPVAERLAYPAQQVHIGWPGFGDTPPMPGITGMEDLATCVLAEIDRPTALVAQSMGGIVAVLAALERPELITHLTLTVTSGGMNMSDLDAQDWRPDFAAANPTLPRWFLDDRTDLTLRLAELRMPVLLLWGDADPISPVRVGQCLAELLPRAQLHVFPGADHSLGCTHADEVAKLIERHLACG
ncbi:MULTISPECIES: alpha/beta fold hydrolase [Pseudomonas]|uniref:Alpha/beta hydrolase n=1 Tax=Pseudomonas rhizophila TaxID=2045200 RepID=A0ABM6UMA3_9PSED|nr:MULTISPECIES: alpha/beta hydrolase [Pseudomonas]MXR28854.1 alpha/beta fold hydrolase [Pseudomonas sp. PICF6]AVU78595.1 alpha/beta hydrolase [Pseudomonas rhizophila]MDD2032166.1 alpha/beta hydrolase [Pseudomonas sp. 39167]MEA1029934.1 alpha/beta hydrolase [Pseudomonas sp. N-137]QKJ33442.1 alpha/beta fold hydrolase [Pseudomonas sp. MPDS]